MLDTIILLSGPAEHATLPALLQGHNPALTVINVATCAGLATIDPAVLRRILHAGVDVVRVNYSHGSADDHSRRTQAVRAAASELGLDIGILAFQDKGTPQPVLSL